MDTKGTTNVTEKKCARCKTIKASTEFQKRRSNKDGLDNYCSACKSAILKEWRVANPEKAKAHSTRQRQEIKNDPMQSQQMRQYHQAYYQKHKERYAKQHKRRYAVHRDQILEGHRSRYKANRDRYLSISRAYRLANPHKTKVWSLRHWTRKKNAEGSHTPEEWKALCEWFGNKCLACGSAERLTIDHVVPLARGGTDYISNIQPLCHSCNCSKQDKTIDYRDPARLEAFLLQVAG